MEQNWPAPITYIGEVRVTAEKNKKASGFWDELNEDQFAALKKFKESLISEHVLENLDKYDDLYLLRFLRARKFDLEKTMVMFKKFIQWRIDTKVDEIRDNFEFTEIFEVKKLYPHSYHKTDKIGRPIYIEVLSKVELDALFKLTTEERMTKYYIREYERLMQRRFPACSAVIKKPVEQSLTILDMDGVGIGRIVGKTRQFIQLASNIGQDYYPEMLGTMMLLNTGFFFNAVWAIVKTFVDEKTRKKINLLGGSYKSKLLELVDAENLPSQFGGSCTCPQIEGGCLYSDIGPWNPKGGIKVGDKDTYIGEK